jgi:two-component system sensor histidine kinase MtrB
MDRVRVLARSVLGVWRRHLQLRVVASTLLVCTVVLLAAGQMITSRIGEGLTDAKVRNALDSVSDGQQFAVRQLETLRPGDKDLKITVNDLVRTLSGRTGPAGRFGVVMQPYTGAANTVASSSIVLGDYHIDQAFSDLVMQNDQLAYQFVDQAPEGGHVRPYLLIGAPVKVESANYALYYFFALDDVAAALALLQRTLLAGGALLALLLVAVVAIVTRLVVSPVRLAARAAERISAGLLSERLAVRGEDDLARLGQSFNDMAASLQTQIRQLEELSRLQRRFTSDVSHELRTPLTTVRLAADLLHTARSEFRPEVARSAELLQNEVDRFESLLGDLLEISRADAGMAVLDPEVLDVRELVARVMVAIGPLAEQVGSELHTDLPEQPVLAEVDSRRIERVLRNLLINAVEHGEGRPVEVRLRGDSSAIAITVRDHGSGFSEAEAEQVFHRFWRADPARARRIGGSGLGLAISLEDARLHGGRLEAWGRPGKGAQFRLTLPVVLTAEFDSSPLPLEPAAEPMARAGRLAAGPAPHTRPALDGRPAAPALPAGTSDGASKRPGREVVGGHA